MSNVTIVLRRVKNMPWAKLAHERIKSMYQTIFAEVSDKFRKPDILAKEALIRAELLKRDFTKRQLVILSFIGTFSYLYGKETAIVPKLKDFSIAGISPTKITDELTKLVEMGIITWERGKDTNEFAINDPREWQASYHSTYNDIRSRELFALNLKHAGVSPDADTIIEKAIAEDERRRSLL
jgi:hypothetical protein